jgi:hypothetical protein
MGIFDNKGKFKDEITCPYCGYKHEDSWECSNSGTFDCDKCDKTFSYERIITIDYYSEADCKLNGEEHDLYEVQKLFDDIPPIYFKCKKCDYSAVKQEVTNDR